MSNSHNHALTEVALALAMAFFSIMVLAMVSMSTASQQVANNTSLTESEQQNIKVLQSVEQGDEPAADSMESLLLIYAHGHLYNEDLSLWKPSQLLDGQEVLLAVDPRSTLSEAVEAKSQIYSPRVSITLLDTVWIKRLEAMK